MTARTRAAGLSLIEMMIALVIGLVLLLGVIQVFSASRTAFQLSEGASRAQENARFALDFLARDIRMAGHFGCVNDQAHFVKGQGDPRVNLSTTTGSGSPLDFSVSIQGYEATGTSPGAQLRSAERCPPPPVCLRRFKGSILLRCQAAIFLYYVFFPLKVCQLLGWYVQAATPLPALMQGDCHV